MNKINSINSIGFRGATTVNNAQTNTNPIESSSRGFNTDFYADSKSVEAIKLNSNIKKPTDITKPVSADNYLAKLERAGMVKSKDYDIFEQPDGGKSIYIKDKDGDAIKTVFWLNGSDEEHYSGYQNISMQKNQSKAITEYDRNNILCSKSIWYEKANEHRNLFPENIDINTKPQDYINKLESNNVNFDIEKYEENDEKSTFVIEKDSKNNPTKMTSFIEYSDGGKFINQSNTPDKYGNFEHEISMVADGNYCDLTVTDYVKKFRIKG